MTSTLSLFVIAFLCGALVGCRARGRARTPQGARAGRGGADLRDETALLERRDEATGLYNSRFFVEALTREIERSRTYGRPLALALASVETRSPGRRGRRRANLRELGVAIGGSVRAIDVACRVGTTEYGVIMPETDTKAASVAAERVLRAIARAGSKGDSTAPGRGRDRRLPGPCRVVRGADRAGRIGASQRPRGRPRGVCEQARHGDRVDGSVGRRRRVTAGVRDLGGGLWTWTARHPEWHPGEFGAVVRSYAARSGDHTLLIDPLVLSRRRPGKSWTGSSPARSTR